MSAPQQRCRHWALAAALTLWSASTLSQGMLVYVGSGGCDDADKTCKEMPEQETVLQAIAVHPDGDMVSQPDLAMDVGDLPVWLALREVAEGRCLFVTRPNKNDIMSYRLGPDGTLQPGSSATPSGGRSPVFAAVTLDGRFLLVANYNGPDSTKSSNGASAASLRVEDNCSLTLIDSKPHNGSSIDPDRQNAAHVHSFVPGRDGFAFACDLGMDIIFTYRVQPTGQLVEVSKTQTSLGLGPRHLVQHPTMSVVYVVCEMGMSVLSYRLAEDGSLDLLQTLSLLEPGIDGQGSKAAEIVLMPDGSSLYVTNRGNQNTITVFSVEGDGTLQQIQQVEAPAFPRGMTLCPGDSLLVVGGQASGEVASFRIQPDGSLAWVGSLTEGIPPNPAAFLPLPGVVGLGVVGKGLGKGDITI